MKKIIKKWFLLFFLLGVISGCTSINSMPQTASQVNFAPKSEGRTGWSKYEEVMFFRGVDKRTAYLAGKAGLADAGFTIKRASYEGGTIIGEHGMTAYDWNVVAGVYIRSEEDGSSAKVLVQGSKDIGLWGDMTDSSWTQDILKGMRNYIYLESQIEDTNKKHFQ